MKLSISAMLQNLLDTNVEEILKSGDPWSRLLIHKDIFNARLKDESSNILIEEILKDSRIQNVCHRILDSRLGIYSLANKPISHKVYGSFYWGFRFFADIGLISILDHSVNHLLLNQLPDGQFFAGYDRNKAPISKVCLTAHFVYCLSKLGYANSRAVQMATNYILTTQRYDGGWHCDTKKLPGESEENAHSCPAANIYVIRALAEQHQDILKPAANQIYDLWNNVESSLDVCDQEIGRMYRKLRYPPFYWGLDLLNIVDTLAFIPDFCHNDVFDQMVEVIVSKWNGTGLFKSEKTIPEWSEFNFAKKNSYSCWLSAIMCRVIKRIYL